MKPEIANVLVIDDVQEAAHLLRKVLRAIGFLNVDEASNGADALRMMEAKSYDLVISDWNMEPMTGLDLLKQIRATPALASTLFMMVTASVDEARVRAALDAGVQGFLVKPYSIEDVRKRVMALITPKR